MPTGDTIIPRGTMSPQEGHPDTNSTALHPEIVDTTQYGFADPAATGIGESNKTTATNTSRFSTTQRV